MGNPELVLYPFKVNSATHTLEMLKNSQLCVPSRQKLTGHLRLLVCSPVNGTHPLSLRGPHEGVDIRFPTEACHGVKQGGEQEAGE